MGAAEEEVGCRSSFNWVSVGRSATESATCLASASASRCALIATPRSASRYRLSQAMPSSTGSRQTRRSSAARCRRSASGSGCSRSRNRRIRRRNADGVSRDARSNAAASNPVIASAGSVLATSSSDRTRPTQIAPPASAASVAPNSPVKRARPRPARRPWPRAPPTWSQPRRRTRGSRTPGPPATRHPSPPRARPRARVPLRCGGTARPRRPDHPIKRHDPPEFGIEHRLKRASRTGGHETTQPPPTDTLNAPKSALIRYFTCE